MELFKIFGEIAIDGTKANRALDAVAQRAGMTTQEVESHINKIGNVASGIMKGMGIVGAAIGGAMLAVTEGTREYRAQMGLLESSFKAAGHSSVEAKNTYSDLHAVLGDTDQAVEAAQHIALIADNEKEMNELTKIGTGIFASYGASLPLEGLYEAIGHTSALGDVQGSLADGLEWAGISVEDFNKKLEACSNEEERQDLIMKTLKDTYGSASEQYKETNKDIIEARKAQEKLTDAMAELGAVGEPILTAIKNKVAEMVSAAVPHLQNFVNKVKDAKKWMENNKDTVDKWKAAIIAVTVSVGSFLLIMSWGRIMAAAKTAIMATRAAVVLFNAALRANPVGLVISLLAGLVAGFVYLWKNNEGFRKFWIDLWNKIKSACSSAITGIKNKFNDLKDAAGRVKKWFEDIRKSIADKIEAAGKSVSKVVDKIKGYFPLKLGKIFDNIRIPKITVSGGKAPFGIAGKGKLPSFDVKWNAEGAVFDKPTIFGTRMGLQGVGEAGAEAVAPINVLQGYVSSAVRSELSTLGKVMIDQNKLLMDFLRRNMPHDIALDSGALVGALVPAVDTGLADRYAYSRRGMAR